MWFFTPVQRYAVGRSMLTSILPHNLPLDSTAFLRPTLSGGTQLQKRWVRKAIKRSRPRSTATPEQCATRIKHNLGATRLADLMSNPESPFTIARNIRSLIAQRLFHWRRTKDFKLRNRFRAWKRSRRVPVACRHVHDDAIVTPLTQLQHSATLPRSALHSRFDFPHSLHYEVFWGPPQTYKEPNHDACKVSVLLRDLQLTAAQMRRLVDTVGEDRIDKHTGIMCLESNVFEQRNHNAAYLGDILQRLITEVKAKS